MTKGTVTEATELRQEAAALVETARKCDLSTTEGRQEADRIMNDVDAKVERAKTIERLHGLGQSLGADAGEGVRLEDVDPEAAEQDAAIADATSTPAYRAAFLEFARRGQRMSREARTILEGTTSGLVTRGMVEGTDADGGYLAPAELLRTIDRVSEPLEIIAPRARVITTSAKAIEMVKGDGVVSFAWTAEVDPVSEDKATFTKDTLTAHGARVLVRVSNDLLDDEVFGLESYIAELAAEDKVLGTEAAFIGGNGNGKPWGIVSRINGENLTPNRFTTAGIGALTGDDLISVTYEPAMKYRRGSAFVLGTQAHKAARLLKDSNGAFIWQAGLAAGSPDTINGYPVLETDDLTVNKAIAGGNDVGFFGNLKRYAIIRRQAVIVQRLVEKYADTNEVGYLFRFREGGDTLDNAAFRTIRVKA